MTPLAPPTTQTRVKDRDVLSRVRAAYHLPPAFILFVGSLEPRKNIPRLLAAYARLKTTLKNEVHLVIVGGQGWLNDDVHATIQKLDLRSRVHCLGYVNEEDLPVLYSLATVFAYPSLYEGFGLPIVEAMQCGAPVLTSNVSALPEVAGNAALLVSPTNIDEIASGLTRLLEQAELRQEFRLRGYQRVQDFSWERCARETLAVYRQVYAG